MQIPSDPRAFIHTFFHAQLQNAARYGPAKKRGDQEGAASGGWHNKQNTALRDPSVRYGRLQVSAHALVNTVDQRGSLRLQWLQFIGQSRVNGIPIARSGE